jgi:FRG domain
MYFRRKKHLYDCEHIRYIDCKSPDELLSMLLPTDDLWQGNQSNWIFRGQGTTKWKLYPSSFRNVREFGYVTCFSEGKDFDPGDQVETEAVQLAMFLQSANESGLYVPRDGFQYISRLLGSKYMFGADKAEDYKRKSPRLDSKGRVVKEDDIWEEAIENWPPRETWELLAIAQHNGVPTRLLDWSFNPIVAAYFASKTAAEWVMGVKEEPVANHKSLAIWAVNLNSFNLPYRYGKTVSQPVDTVAYNNANQAAQRGLFTLLREAGDGKQKLFDLEYNIYSQSVGMFTSPMFSTKPAMLAFLLPSKLSPELIRLLDKSFINEATLFPGYSGVVEHIANRRRLHRR